MGPAVQKETLLNFSLGIKGNFWTKDRRFFFRPGISGGYAVLKEIFILDDSDYITARFTGEAIYRFGKRFGILSEIGFFWALSGGDEERDAYTTSAILILRIGMVF